MCVCERETERFLLCMCVFEFVNHYAIILPVDVITCAELLAVTHTHTHTQSLKLCPGQTLLFILMMPPQSQMQPDINTWPSAKQTVPHQCLCLSQPIAGSAMINPGVLLQSTHTHT